MFNASIASGVLVRADQDDSLRQVALSTLRTSGYPRLNRIDCRVEDGFVQLFGSVPTFFLKQIAQTVIQRVDGVRGIRNELRVT